MNDLVVNNQLPPTIVDHQCSNTASPISKAALNLIEQAIIIDNSQSLFHIPGLSHTDNSAIVTDIQDAVLLEHRSQHALHIHARLGVCVEGALLLQLLGEEVHAEVAVLPGLSAHADADDLAGPALQDDEVADADEVARDGNGVDTAIAATTRLDKADCLGHATADTAGTISLIDDDFSVLIIVVVMVVMEWVADTVCCTLETAAEGVVLAVVVVVTHVALVFSVDLDVCFNSYVSGWATAFVLDVVIWVGAAAIVSFGNVELILDDSVVVLTAIVLNVNGVSDAATINFDVDFGVLVLGWTLVPESGALADARSGGKIDLLFTSELYLRVAVVTHDSITFFVDSDILSVTAPVVADVDVDFLFGVSSIFPSARGATTKFGFPFYLCLGSFFGSSVTPVRRREDTDRNGDAGVKVQLARWMGASTLFSLAAVESQD